MTLYHIAIIPMILLLSTQAASGSETPPAKRLADPLSKIGAKWSKQYDCDRAVFPIAGGNGFIIFPPATDEHKPLPWVWYAPTFIDQYPGSCNEWISRKLLAEGIAVCGVDVGESYGNPQGRATYTGFYRFLVEKCGFASKACLWPQSRGGLMLYNWAAEHPKCVKCIAGTYTVCDMASWPGLEKACGAYGMTADELRKDLKKNNPIDRLAPLAKHRIPILHIHGDSDTVVPLEANSAELARRYKALGGDMELIIIPGKGHAEIPEFFENQRFVDFLVTHAEGGSRK